MASKIKKETEMILCLGNQTPALRCSGMKGATNYYESWSPFSKGRVAYCKDCCQKMIEYYINQGSSMKSAVYHTCAKLDIPFIMEIWQKVEDQVQKNRESGKRVNNYLGIYISELHKSKSKQEVWDEWSATDVNLSDIDSRIEQRDVQQKELEQWEFDWGVQDSVKDYKFLNNLWNRYTKDIEFINPQQEDKYRDLCLDRLAIRQINDGTYKGDETLDNIQKRVDRTMKVLKVDEFESNKPKTDSEKTLFEKIRLVDENNVRDIYNKQDSKYYDINKIRQYNTDMVLRPLGNMLAGNKDFNISMDDMEKYNLD